MTELMGMIYGAYDAKVGFQPGGLSLHGCYTPHGPDTATFVGASNKVLTPEKFTAGLAFMFETSMQLTVHAWAADTPFRDVEYSSCWRGMPHMFQPGVKDSIMPVTAALDVPHPKLHAAGSAKGTVHDAPAPAATANNGK